jgi:hypothetical protein
MISELGSTRREYPELARNVNYSYISKTGI